MKLFSVQRHYCNPSIVYVLAKTKKRAKDLTNAEWGYCDTDVNEISMASEKVVTPKNYTK